MHSSNQENFLNHGQLPLNIMGLVSPFLAWVEGVAQLGVPHAWTGRTHTFRARQKAWLMRELPNYSFDNLDEIIQIGAAGNVPTHRSAKLPHHLVRSISSLDLPLELDLVFLLGELGRHFFKWSTNDLLVGRGMLTEVHELARRFSVNHLIRFMHAEVVANGYLAVEEVEHLPTQFSELHVAEQGLRSVVGEGISENHIHMGSMVHAEDVWADRICSMVFSRRTRSLSAEEDRLVYLGASACRALALGLLMDQLKVDRFSRDNRDGQACGSGTGDLFLPPMTLIRALDDYYLCPGNSRAAKVRQARSKIEQLFRKLIGKLRCYIEQHSVPRQYQWLWLFINPPKRGHDLRELLATAGFERGSRLGIRQHVQLLSRLNFASLRQLIVGKERLAKSEENRANSKKDRTNGARAQADCHVFRYLNQIYFRYILFHTHHWQNVSQHGKTTGLRYFKRFFDSRYKRPITEKIEARGMGFENMVSGTPLQNLEGRVGPPDRVAELRPYLLSFAKHLQKGDLERFGFVIHFIKEEYETPPVHHAKRVTSMVRHGFVRRRTRRQAFRVFRLLSFPNAVMPFVVGIDAANVELTTPPEVFAPAFRFLREFPIQIHRRKRSGEFFGKYQAVFDLLKQRRLGMTYHVGEDFRHLLSGLRAIDEVLTFLRPMPGDRLGHAIALGLKPEIWAAQIGFRAIMPKQEWLDTLVWIHHLLGPGHDLIGELAIEDTIQKLSRQIYGPTLFESQAKKSSSTPLDIDWTIPTLYDAWRLRQLDPYSVDVVQLSNNKEFRLRTPRYSLEERRWHHLQQRCVDEVDAFVGSNAAYSLLAKYWYDPGVYKRGKTIMTLPMHREKRRWLKLCYEVQARMVSKVAEAQISLEANPSSNRMIGPLASYDDHHLLDLTFGEGATAEARLRATINTDNPGLVGTSLAHEYYLMGEVLLARGVPETAVVGWLEELRKFGRASSFLRFMPDPKHPAMRNFLEELLDRHERGLVRRLEGRATTCRSLEPIHIKAKR